MCKLYPLCLKKKKLISQQPTSGWEGEGKRGDMEEKVERDREGQRGGRKTEVEDIWREREREKLLWKDI